MAIKPVEITLRQLPHLNAFLWLNGPFAVGTTVSQVKRVSSGIVTLNCYCDSGVLVIVEVKSISRWIKVYDLSGTVFGFRVKLKRHGSDIRFHVNAVEVTEGFVELVR